MSQNGPAAASSSRAPGTTASQTSLQDRKEKEKPGWEVLAKLVLNMVRTKRREKRDDKPRVPLERRYEDEVSVSGTFTTGSTAVESARRSEEHEKDETEKEKEKDKERWARLKRIKQAFTIKKARKKEGSKAGLK